MELHDALTQISDIRRHMARTQVFRGYRAATAGLSGAIALLAASVQRDWAPNPFENVVRLVRTNSGFVPPKIVPGTWASVHH